MPPKERKSLAQWMLCQGCGCTISNKDVLRHSENSCPPAVDKFIHGFIKEDKTLCNTVEEQKSDSGNLKLVPRSEHANTVQLSKQAMQICGFVIGEPVLVEVEDRRGLFIAWPTPEGSLLSIFFTRAGLGLLGCRVGEVAKVRALNTAPRAAQELHVTQEEPSDQLDAEQLALLLRGQQQGRTVMVGSYLLLRHLGLNLRFRVTKAVPFPGNEETTVEKLADNIKNLDITEGATTTFFRVQFNTSFILNSESQDIKESVETLADIGGLDDVIAQMQEILQIALSTKNPFPGLKPSRGVLLYGVPGSGKSMLARALAQASGATFLMVQGPDVFSKFYGETETKLKDIFADAIRRAPSVLFLDDADVLCQRRGGGGSQQEQRVVSALLSQLDALRQWPVMVLAATSRPDAIDEAFRRPGRLDREIELPVPGPEARHQILQKILIKIPNQLSEEQVQSISNSTHGFVGADLLALVSQASLRAVKLSNKEEPQLLAEHLEWAMTKVRPSAMREVTAEIPSVRWSDIGGQHELKQQLRQAVEWPLLHPEAFKRLGIRPPRGVLMFGPPGCSKTMIARALATESGLNFLSIKGPELFSKWVGESERAVRAVFRRARQVAPAIVFFDELDALCGERGTSTAAGGSSVQERVLAQLLTELDGVEPLGNVTVVAATNRPDRIDKALLRPGRLDRIVHVPLPDLDTRREIFALQFRKMPISPEVDLESLVLKTQRYSGAEVTAVCHEAALAALQEDISAVRVERRHFDQALRLVSPRTPDSLLQIYQSYQQGNPVPSNS